jgi:amino acid adenylation domain-containing protein
VNELLTELRERQVKLWREGDLLRFSAPAGVLTPELRAAMNAKKGELLEGLARESQPMTSPGAEAGVLSFAQERLWVVDRLDPGLPHYNVPICWRIAGPLDVEALARALEEIERRHQVLRTVFAADAEGRPVVMVRPPQGRSLSPITVSVTELEQLLREEAERPFDLAAGPVWRRSLARFSEQDHALFITWHHIAFDAWSVSVFIKELSALYRAFHEKRPTELGELPMQYADFARQQRKAASAAPMQAHLDYWRKKLGGHRPPLALPYDHSRPAKIVYRGASRSRALPGELYAQVRNLARQEGVPPFVFLLAAFKVLLVRFTGDADLCVGTPIAQRSRVECEGLIGFFLNMLAIRTEVTGDPSFRALLGRVRTSVFDAYRHQDAPFEKIVEELQPERDLSQHPIFQVGFVLQPSESGVPALAGASVSPVEMPMTTAKFDLTLFLREEGPGLQASLEYRTDLFAEETIDRWLASFEVLLAGIVADVRTPISRLPLLPAAEARRLLVEWNGTARGYPQDRTVQSLFEECAARHPDAIAIIDGGGRVSYRVLNERANAIAGDLQASGVTSGSLVGVPAERSVLFLASVLGILKAGGAYVPLDSAEPAERLGKMLSQCETTIEFTTLTEARVVENPAAVSGAGSPACMLFTSGSTGLPKGVVVPHRAINRLVIQNDYAPFAPGDVVGFAANPCFDAATFEIWGALLHGATLVIVPHEILLSPPALEAHLTKHGVTVLFLTTSLFNRLAHEAPAMFRSLRHLVFGGEVADAASVRLVLEHGKPERLVNGYGPTEATTFAVCQQIDRMAGARIPIGRPIANTQVYLLDAAQQPVPIGVTGEIHIGGPGLALGYHDAPELTAERFIETRFGRLYRTRDLARWLPDGTLDYLGRADGQIKMRGFRIEPTEIENALRRVPGIADCRVIGDHERITAYFISSADGPPTGEELRAQLAEFLPVQMLPTACVAVSAFPLTRNGKLDRDALPTPGRQAAITEAPCAPRSPLEAEVAQIWDEVLGSKGSGVNDDFFALGGHSLMAIRLLGRVREKFEIDLPVRRLFEAPTVAGVAEFITSRRQASASASPRRSLLAIQRGDDRRRPFFLVPGGWGGEIEFLVYGQFARHLGAEVPFYGFRARGFDGHTPPHRSVAEMAADYIAEIRAQQPHGPYLIGGECVGGVAAYEIARQLSAAGEKIALLALLDTCCPCQEALKEFCAGERAKARQHFWEVRVQQPVREHLEKLSRLSAGEKLRYVWERSIGRGPRSAESAPIEDRKLLEHYPRLLMGHRLEPYAGRVTLLLPQDAHDTVEETGWTTAPTGGIDIHPLPGDHLSYIREHAATAATRLRELIEQAERSLSC